MVLVIFDPTSTDLSPEFDAAKLKAWLIVNEALASALAVNPALNALALITALLVRLIGPV